MLRFGHSVEYPSLSPLVRCDRCLRDSTATGPFSCLLGGLVAPTPIKLTTNALCPALAPSRGYKDWSERAFRPETACRFQIVRAPPPRLDHATGILAWNSALWRAAGLARPTFHIVPDAGAELLRVLALAYARHWLCAGTVLRSPPPTPSRILGSMFCLSLGAPVVGRRRLRNPVSTAPAVATRENRRA